MCGINGMFAYHSAAVAIDREELIRTRDHMAARGPDDAAVWVCGNNRCGMGHRRLSIIDLSPTGAQPMASANGNLVVTFNGEIYTEKKPISDLATVGIYLFRRGSDFVRAAVDMIARNDRVQNEFYTCPVYNYMLAQGARIGVYEVPASAMHGLGTPEDLDAYLARRSGSAKGVRS
jgi:hypothetical protein